MAALAETQESQEIPQSPEFHLHGGRDVLKAMLQKQSLLSQGLFEESDAMGDIDLVIPGGGHRVINAVGPIEVLFERGMFQGYTGPDGKKRSVITRLFVASGGVPVAEYGLLGDRRGYELFRVNCEAGFAVRHNLVTSRGRYGIDFAPMHAVIAEHNLGEALAEVVPDMYVGLIDAHTGELEMVNIKDFADNAEINAVIAASCLMPVISKQKTITIGGRDYIDGSLHGLPVRQLAEQYGSRYMLILENQPAGKNSRERRIAGALQNVGKGFGIRKNTPVRVGLACFAEGIVAQGESMAMNWLTDVVTAIHTPMQARVGVLTRDFELLKEIARESGISLENEFVLAEQELAVERTQGFEIPQQYAS